MAVEQVGPVHALPPELGVEVKAAGGEAAASKDLVDRRGELVDRVGELVGVPAVLRVTSVGIDAAKDVVVHGVGDLVMERVAGQRGVVHLDVDVVLTEQVVPVEEPVHRRGIVVVLVFCGLLRFWFEEEQSVEADAPLVFCYQLKESGKLVRLLAHPGVEQGLVPFAAAPQHVVLPAEPVGCFKHVSDLGCGVGEDIRVRVGRRSGGVPGVGEQVCGTPQQVDAGFGHLGRGPFNHPIEVGPRLLQGCPLRRHVHIMEAVVGHAEFCEELKRCVLFCLCSGHGVRPGIEPRPVKRAGAEHVGTRPAEAVPVADGDPKVFGHGLACHHPVRLVDPVGQIGRGCIVPAEANWFRYVSEELHRS